MYKLGIWHHQNVYWQYKEEIKRPVGKTAAEYIIWEQIKKRGKGKDVDQGVTWQSCAKVEWWVVNEDWRYAEDN